MRGQLERSPFGRPLRLHLARKALQLGHQCLSGCIMTTFLRSSILVAAAIAVIADVPHISPAAALSSGDIPPITMGSALKQASADTPVVQTDTDVDAQEAAAKDRDAAQVKGDPNAPMKPEMKVQIIRFIDGEFGKAAKPLPGKPSGFTLQVGKPISDQDYQDALRLQGTAIGAGDPIQVTRVDFEGKRIVLQLNGGAKKKFHLMDHLQIGLGGGGTDPSPVGPSSTDGSLRRAEGMGAVVVLDYGKPLPDVSPEEIKAALSPLIDFTKQPSAAVNWVETLPPAFQNAVRDHKALPGMDAQTVIAAVGHPDRKVREKNMDGIETEDWIYGNPPARTIFVTFISEKVTKVEECGGPQSDTTSAPTCGNVR
jgi:hypothetical protein